jgi:hypothetical protein
VGQRTIVDVAAGDHAGGRERLFVIPPVHDSGKSRSDLAEIPSEQGIIREWVRAAPVITANNIGTTVYNSSFKCTVG